MAASLSAFVAKQHISCWGRLNSFVVVVFLCRDVRNTHRNSAGTCKVLRYIGHFVVEALYCSAKRCGGELAYSQCVRACSTMRSLSANGGASGAGKPSVKPSRTVYGALVPKGQARTVSTRGGSEWEKNRTERRAHEGHGRRRSQPTQPREDGDSRQTREPTRHVDPGLVAVQSD